MTLLRTLQNANHLARALPRIVDVVRDGRTIVAGSSVEREQALQRLTSPEGVQSVFATVLDVVDPGAGHTAERLFQNARSSSEEVARRIVEGEFRELDDGPHRFSSYARWLADQPSGGWVFLGPRKSGKTSKVRRLAQVLQTKGFRIRAVNVYGHDNPGWIEPVTMDEFFRIADQMAEYMALQPTTWDREAGAIDPEKQRRLERMLDPIRDQVLIVEEASLSLMGSKAQGAREVVAQVVNQARHVNLHVIVIAQMTGAFPPSLVNCDGVFVGRPLGSEPETDRPDNRAIRELWRDAVKAFNNIRREELWPTYPDVRFWAHVHSPSFGKQAGPWKGLMPFERDTDQIGAEHARAADTPPFVSE